MSDEHTFKLRNYVETHSCEADGKNKNAQATCGWVADKLEGFLRSHPQMKPKDLILEVLDKFGVGISYYTAWKAKVRVLERINEFNGDYLQSLSWGPVKAYKVPKHVTFMDQLEEEEPDVKKWDKPLLQFMDKYSLAVMGLLHQRRELACEMEDNELIPVVRDVIERLEKKHTRYCSPFYHVNAFRATYGGYIFPFDNEEDWGKVKPEDVVQPLPLERHLGRPKKQRIRGDDEAKATSKRKCKKCLEPGHNKRTCPLGKDQPSKKSRKADEANEGEDIKPKVGNAENNEGERAEKVVAKGGHDSPTRTRGGRRRGGDNNVNVQLVIDVPD
ncbi:hypothetical protein IFM89_027554 [Coptis chinensis]|uniref:CCHC-type domain-containing protein n=1 Tax=Coptis chinensis TaxID=261450 RepID=A0A835LPB4_9MAGN|nr:hypothetical protein IFM89_027554 [Coptis chinensis]